MVSLDAKISCIWCDVAPLSTIGKYRLKNFFPPPTFMISDINQDACLRISLFSTLWYPLFKKVYFFRQLPVECLFHIPVFFFMVTPLRTICIQLQLLLFAPYASCSISRYQKCILAEYVHDENGAHGWSQAPQIGRKRELDYHQLLKSDLETLSTKPFSASNFHFRGQNGDIPLNSLEDRCWGTRGD